MGIFYCSHTRRQFLRGTGGSLLALPLLQSLIPKAAHAQATTTSPRLAIFTFHHNNIDNLWPSASLANTPVGNSGVMEGMLSAGPALSTTKVLKNPLYDSLQNRDLVTIIKGLDIATSGSAHGNFSVSCGANRQSGPNFPSIDSILENSNTLYPSSTPGNVRKALRFGGGIFYEKVGNNLQSLPGYDRRELATFYREVFASLSQGTVPAQDLTNQLKSNILNRVFESYQQYKTNRRISSDDKAKLDQHMDFITDLQNSFANSNVVPITCDRPNDPGNSELQIENIPLFYQLMATAIRCGLTKVIAVNVEGQNPQWIPGMNVNGNVVHGCIHGEFGQNLKQIAYERWFHYFADQIAENFMKYLDVEEGNSGRTYLENMVTGMLCPGKVIPISGSGGHSGRDNQQVLFGNMGGKLRSGRLYHFPRPGNRGVPYNSFLISLMELMGVPPADYAYATNDGKGIGYYGNIASSEAFYNRRYQALTEIHT